MESAAEPEARDGDPAKATEAEEMGRDLGPAAMVRDPGQDWVSAKPDRHDRSTESSEYSGAWVISPSTSSNDSAPTTPLTYQYR